VPVGTEQGQDHLLKLPSVPLAERAAYFRQVVAGAVRTLVRDGNVPSRGHSPRPAYW